MSTQLHSQQPEKRGVSLHAIAPSVPSVFSHTAAKADHGVFLHAAVPAKADHGLHTATPVVPEERGISLHAVAPGVPGVFHTPRPKQITACLHAAVPDVPEERYVSLHAAAPVCLHSPRLMQITVCLYTLLPQQMFSYTNNTGKGSTSLHKQHCQALSSNQGVTLKTSKMSLNLLLAGRKCLPSRHKETQEKATSQNAPSHSQQRLQGKVNLHNVDPAAQPAATSTSSPQAPLS
jgi:hypothetical protein